MSPPLYDPHIHFSGCITPEFVGRVLRQPVEGLREAMTMTDYDPRTLSSFLSKFDVYSDLQWNEELLIKASAEVARCIHDMGLAGAWLRLTINRYVAAGITAQRCIDIVSNVLDHYLGEGRVRLLLAVPYEAPVTWQMACVGELMDHPKLWGIDLVGDETRAHLDCSETLLRCCSNKDKVAFAHVGESITPQQTKERIGRFYLAGTRNFCHGVRLFTGPDICAALGGNAIWFHMAPTSNYLTGAVPSDEPHPLILALEHDVKITVGSDDPVQCGCTTQSEVEFFGVGETRDMLLRNAQEHWTQYDS